jgi:phenylalanyl-tRNA synthetase alpha chain
MGKNLHQKKDHPLQKLQKRITSLFTDFKIFDQVYPVVSVEDNFDRLLVPHNHPSRSPSDTYYLDNKEVLRTHTSAHQHQLLRRGNKKFLVVGDVYRKDEIDRNHYPVFHQIEGVCIYPDDEREVEEKLHHHIYDVMSDLFPNMPTRRLKSSFPFTHPSWEYEVFFKQNWLEILGCGIIQPEILKSAEVKGKGWAFGMGLERLAMALYDIPDIRYFWSDDPRTTDQFKDMGDDFKFKPYSLHPSCYKDIAFWLKGEFNTGEFFQMIRDEGQDLIERVVKTDTYTREDGKTSICYRIFYCSMDRTLTNEEIDTIQFRIRKRMSDFNVELR